MDRVTAGNRVYYTLEVENKGPATADDVTSGVTKVEYFLDGALITSATSLPYLGAVNTTAWSEGRHTLTARATTEAARRVLALHQVVARRGISRKPA